jgi:Fe-S cluster biosynthesis and repair protein YggX
MEELKSLNKIPTSQAPFIPQNFLDIIKFPIWGIRSKIDHFLINRLMKSKDPKKRYRLFNSINWVLVYQNPEMEVNLKSYFKNNHLGKNYFNSLLNRAVERKNFKQWPFANTELINGASLNMEIDLIKFLKKEDKT